MARAFTQGHALTIGIANYENVSKLPEIVLKDAKDVSGVLKAAHYCGYSPSHVELLLDGQATAAGIRQSLDNLSRRAGPDDTVVVFFSGHGGRIEADPDAGAYLIPFECEPRRLPDTAISSSELTRLLSAIKAKRLVVLLDACHSAGVGELKAVAPIREIKAGFDEKTYSVLAQGTGRVIMSSSRSNEVSLVLHGMQNSLFTYYLLEALKGACPTHGDGLVRIFDVFHYIADQVPARASQHPIFKAHDVETNFPLALHLGGKNIASPNVSQAIAIAHSPALTGKVKLAIIRRLVTRWRDLATYFETPPYDQEAFTKGHEPRHLLDWLDERKRLGELRDAFNFLGWDDLIEELDSQFR